MVIVPNIASPRRQTAAIALTVLILAGAGLWVRSSRVVDRMVVQCSTPERSTAREGPSSSWKGFTALSAEGDLILIVEQSTARDLGGRPPSRVNVHLVTGLPEGIVDELFQPILKYGGFAQRYLPNGINGQSLIIVIPLWAFCACGLFALAYVMCAPEDKPRFSISLRCLPTLASIGMASSAARSIHE